MNVSTINPLPIHTNNFNLLRLIAAWLILFGHSFGLYGSDWKGFDLITSLALNIFFVISGYLVTGSWLRNPDLCIYARNRIYRIVPGLLVAVLVCVFVMGPIATTLPLGEYLTNGQTWKYLRTALVFPLEYQLPGVFEIVPYPNTVNGSLWSLKVEARCYVLLAIVAIIGLKHWVPPALSIAFFLLFIMATEFTDGSAKRILGIKYSDILHNSRWMFSFFAGAAFYLWRDSVRLNLRGFAIVLAFALLSFAMPSGKYLYIACLPYLILYLALATPRIGGLIAKHDISYGVYLYAFPVQQLYMHFIGDAWGLPAFILCATAGTIMCAILSWLFVERHWLKRKAEAPEAKAQQI